MNAPMRKAVVIDQWDLLRSGIEQVLESRGISVVASSSRAAEAIRVAREQSVELAIVGRHADLKPQIALKRLKHLKSEVSSEVTVVLLIDHAEAPDVARLVSGGADALLLRTISRGDLELALRRLDLGDRVVAPSLADGQVGRIGPALGLSVEDAVSRTGLSPKELEVLAVLAEGGTYEEMASDLLVSRATIKTHLVHIYKKLQVKNRSDAIAKALALGLLT